ncbi:MAG: PspC domain-containing protein [Anaerolineae bacterium]|nr:PspC domain-containing protein [Anaerolineae bacterium]
MGIVAYIVLALVIPEEPIEHAQAKQAQPGWGAGWQRSLNNASVGLVVGFSLVLIGGVLLLNGLGLIPSFVYDLWRLFWRLFWPLLLIGLGIIVILGLSGHPWRGSSRPLRRSPNRVIAGVCGGLGEYLGVDPTLVRAFWIFATLVSFGLGVLAYLVLMLVMPEPGGPVVRPGRGPRRGRPW